ncbi:methyltransferase domain-containing protein [Tribonema minus]|uniref:Methyltransferase domain-containing protein n=1 Tax=Tribonema minus TaxID=303371 RepID=A0A835YKU2_9STRA|nr:methyltransferase domain-containing protein [Tribonema minus]
MDNIAGQGEVEGGIEVEDGSSSGDSSGSSGRPAATTGTPGAAAAAAAPAAAAQHGIENPYRPAAARRRGLPARALFGLARTLWRCYVCTALVVLTLLVAGAVALVASALSMWAAHQEFITKGGSGPQPLSPFLESAATAMEVMTGGPYNYTLAQQQRASAGAGAAGVKYEDSHDAAAAAAADAANSTDPQCARLFMESTRRWTQRVCDRRADTRAAYANIRQPTWDPWEPEFDCEVRDRVGLDAFAGIKPRVMCSAALLAKASSCLAYSFGDSGIDGFLGALLRLAPNCEASLAAAAAAAPSKLPSLSNYDVHVFDPAERAKWLHAKTAKSAGYSFHLLGLGTQAQQEQGAAFRGGALLTLQRIMADLGHAGRAIHVLKLDCDGCALGALQEQVFAPMARAELRVHNVQAMEMRAERVMGLRMQPMSVLDNQPNPMARMGAFFEGADAAGLRTYHKDGNHLGCTGILCADYAFVSAEWARMAFHDSHCPATVASPEELGPLRARLPCRYRCNSYGRASAAGSSALVRQADGLHGIVQLQQLPAALTRAPGVRDIGHMRKFPCVRVDR